jgi:hypothetical protein
MVPKDSYAVKFPSRRGSWNELSPALAEGLEIDADIDYESLEHEKEIYQRLGQNDGIMSCLDLSGVDMGDDSDDARQSTRLSEVARATAAPYR